MGIWIRSRDKEILIESNNIQVCNSDCKWLILTHGNIVATYSSKEKALKVLDMIQEEVNREVAIYLDVFQMPQDDEV